MSNFKSRKFYTRTLKGYIGKQEVITTRSSWETKIVNLLQQLVTAGAIKGWNSEEAVFEYAKTIDAGQFHRYFMDFVVFKNDGSMTFIEVKPLAETLAPFPKKNMTDKQIASYEKAVHTFLTNSDKWTTVMDWCKSNNSILESGNPRFSFQIWTEKLVRPGQIKFYQRNKKNITFPVYPIIPV